MLLFFFFAPAVFFASFPEFSSEEKDTIFSVFVNQKKLFGSFVGGKPVEVLFFIHPLNFPITQPQAPYCLEKHLDVDWVNDVFLRWTSDGSI